MIIANETESELRVGIVDGWQEKTGVGIRTTIQSISCPPACPFMDDGGCYAAAGTVSWYWAKIDKGTSGMAWGEFIARVRHFPRAPWRHAQAGDHAGHANKLDRDKCIELARANDGRKVVSYSHYPVTDSSREALWNLEVFAEMRALGFNVNASCETFAQVDTAIARGMTAVCVVPEDAPTTARTPQGRRGVVCPAQRDENTTCFGGKGSRACGNGTPLCAIAGRDWFVMFKVHGVRTRAAAATLKAAA